MGLSEAGHLYNPAPRSSHLLISKCNSVFARAACCAGGGSDDEHPASAKNPNTVIAENISFAILPAFERRLTIELPPAICRCLISCEPRHSVLDAEARARLHHRQLTSSKVDFQPNIICPLGADFLFSIRGGCRT